MAENDYKELLRCIDRDVHDAETLQRATLSTAVVLPSRDVHDSETLQHSTSSTSVALPPSSNTEVVSKPLPEDTGEAKWPRRSDGSWSKKYYPCHIIERLPGSNKWDQLMRVRFIQDSSEAVIPVDKFRQTVERIKVKTPGPEAKQTATIDSSLATSQVSHMLQGGNMRRETAENRNAGLPRQGDVPGFDPNARGTPLEWNCHKPLICNKSSSNVSGMFLKREIEIDVKNQKEQEPLRCHLHLKRVKSCKICMGSIEKVAKESGKRSKLQSGHMQGADDMTDLDEMMYDIVSTRYCRGVAADVAG